MEIKKHEEMMKRSGKPKIKRCNDMKGINNKIILYQHIKFNKGINFKGTMEIYYIFTTRQC